MLAERYTQALIRALDAAEPKEHGKLVDNFILHLKAQHHEKLLPRIVALLKQQRAKHEVVLTVANEKDASRARKESGAPNDAHTVVDPRLIGGWHLKTKQTLTDASYKTALIDLYRTITT